MACGAAAGVAAAFGAPIGGVLFAIEEGASHWRRALVWRTFFCTIVTTWVLKIFFSGIGGNWGVMSSAGMFSFGSFDENASLTWSAWELPFFLLLGLAGGLLGNVMIVAQTYITRFRMKYITPEHRARRMVEVACVLALQIVVQFLFSHKLHPCKPRPPVQPTAPYAQDLESLYCAPDEYNELASMFMVPAEVRGCWHRIVTVAACALLRTPDLLVAPHASRHITRC